VERGWRALLDLARTRSKTFKRQNLSARVPHHLFFIRRYLRRKIEDESLPAIKADGWRIRRADVEKL